MDSVHGSPNEPRFYLEFGDDDEEQQKHRRRSSIDLDEDDDDEPRRGRRKHHEHEDEDEDEDEEDQVSQAPQWPQSYRKSMDIYSHMPSPSFGFLTSPAVSRGSMLSASLGKHMDSATSILDPLLSSYKKLPETDQKQEPQEPVILESEREPTTTTTTTTTPEPLSKIASKNKIYADCHLNLPEQGCNFFQATLNGINVLAGVGVLSTPYAISQGGWIGVVLLLIFALACCYTGILLRRCLESSPGLVTYPDIGQAAFGNTGRLIISIILYTELYACCVEFLILEGDNLASIFSAAQFGLAGYHIEPHKAFAMIAALVILPTVWLRDLSLLSYISAGGVLASFIVVFTVWWVGAVDGVGFHHTGRFVNFSNLPVAIGLFGFCFSGHAVFPNIYSSMKKGAQFNRVLQLCFLLCILMYGGVAVMGFTMFGDQTASQVTLNLPNHFLASKLALWTTVITPLTKYALTITPVALSLEELLPSQFTVKNHWASVAIRTALVASTLGVAILIPFFGFVMAFIGSFLSLTGSLILPCACYLSIQRKKLSALEVTICLITILTGIVAAAAGTYSSVTGIIDQFRSL